MITLANYTQKISPQFVEKFSKELKENHFKMLELIQLITGEPEIYNDTTVKKAVDTHLRMVNEFISDISKEIEFEATRNGQKVEIDEAKVERDLANLCFSPNPRPSKIGDLVRKNTLTNQVQKTENNIYSELEQDIIDQRNNQSRLSVRDICRKNKCLYWDYRQAFNLLVEKKVIDPHKIYPIKFGRPKKKL